MLLKKVQLYVCLASIIAIFSACSQASDTSGTTMPESQQTTQSDTAGEIKETSAPSQENTEGTIKETVKETIKETAKETDAKKAFLGKWVVAKLLPTLNVSAVSEEDFNKTYSDKEAVYAADYAQFGDETCKNPDYREKDMSAEEFARLYSGATFEQLGIKADSAKVIEIFNGDKQWLNPGGMIIIKDESTLISFWDGAFFEMTAAQ